MKKTIKLDIPRQLELLCSLMDMTPEDLLQSFINDVSHTTQSNGSDERMMADEYLLRIQPGQTRINTIEIKTMLLELDIIRYERCQFAMDNEVAYKRHVRKRLKEWYTCWQKIKTDR